MNININFNHKSFHSSYVTNAYEYFGSFYTKEETTFRVYCPHATMVSVVGDFNNWDNKANIMKKVDEMGIWELTILNVNIRI